MIWFRTGVLSDKEINRLLGKKIFIWPFIKENLKGSTYNLTASIMARSLSTKALLTTSDKKINIPPGDTALILTEESTYVTKDICGTYHSKVKLVSQGLSHISTTLDPLFFGSVLVAVHNHSTKTKTIAVGDSFVSLMLHKMKSSSKILHDNTPSRSDFFTLIKEDEVNDNELKNMIKKWNAEKWRINKEDLMEEVQNYIRDRKQPHRINKYSFALRIVVPFIIILILTICFVSNYFPKNLETIILPLTAFILPLFDKINNWIIDYLSRK